MNLHDRVALIVGGARIGATIALALADRGADLVLSYNRSQDSAVRTAGAIEDRGRRAVILQADVTREEECRALVTAAAGRLGRLDVLVHMASIYKSTPFDELTTEAFDRVMAVDLRSAFLCARAAVPHLRAAGGGRIIAFSDWTPQSGRPRYLGYLPYYVAKAGVIGLVEALALELAPDGILVNAIAPGPILAPPDLSPDDHQAVVRATPLGRWGGPDEIARAVIALIESDFITGETIRVDGGRHLR